MGTTQWARIGLTGVTMLDPLNNAIFIWKACIHLVRTYFGVCDPFQNSSKQIAHDRSIEQLEEVESLIIFNFSQESQ